jgi:subtilisin family serine protease
MLLGSAGIYLVQTPAGVGVQTLVAQLRNDSRILYAEPNFYGHAPEGGGRTKWAWAGDNPSPDGDKYANALLNLEQAHAISKGDGVVVAVLDTGMQLDHPLLAGRWTAARYDFVDDDAVPDEAFATLDRDGDGFVDESAGHGTHVAAIVHRAAPEAQIMPLRVLDASGRGNVFLIAEAVLFAAQNGAHVINLSLGTTRESALLSEMIEDAITEQGIVVVAAAGNLNGSQRQYPAATDGVLAVTAVDQNKARAGFANYGSWVDIAAPGVSIFSAFPIDTYAFWDGTSMATPFIAGQAALLRSLDPSLSATQIENYILATADPLGSGLGAGLANFAASLAAAPTPANPPGNDNDPAQGGTLPAPTEETTCNGSLGAVTVDNLRVPQNGSCNLEGTRVEGTIYVENGATLTALRIRVIGNIQAEGAAAVNVATASTVGGSIQVKQGAAANINDVAVTGDIQFESNSAALKAIGNTVGGNIQVVQNTGGVEISRNVIDGNLQCKENNPAPTGGDNVVHGSAEDQCANLGGGTISPPTVLVIQAYLPMIQR